MRQTPAMTSGAEDEAAFWFARMRSQTASARDSARFTRWLNSHPENAEAYAELEAFWSSFQDVAADEAILAMRKEALLLAPERRESQWHKLTALAATIAIFLLAGILLLDAEPRRVGDRPSVAQVGDPSIYRTEVGQRSAITLADGSVVELNTDSVLQVNYADSVRGVRLLRGQALFEVAHDSSRPFVVEAGGQRITALGTSFDVRLRSGEMRVTLIEGRIAVERAEEEVQLNAPDAVLRLRPGEQLVASAERPFLVRNISVEQAVSWRTGRVIFSDEPLGEVIEEINRYSTRKVVLGDRSLADLRVSGVFRAGSVGSFVTALDATFPVSSHVDEATNNIVLTWE